MLEWLKLENVGPAPKFELDFAPRVNLITGDNGLGKSFLLDVAWFGLTGAWREPILPRTSKNKQAKIEFHSNLSPEMKVTQEHVFDDREQKWIETTGYRFGDDYAWIDPKDLVIDVRIDGELGIFDPVRNPGIVNAIMGNPKNFLFSSKQIWDGLEHNKTVVCNGLIRDWGSWQRENNTAFNQLKSAFVQLSPSQNELLEPGELTRVSLNDARDIPTIKMPYGQQIPIVHASAGIRRIVALSYSLVWAWQEHLRACEITKREPVKSIIILIDELEEHLHPRWQRILLPSLLGVIQTLTSSHKLAVQIIATTHSPMVMSSLEPLFNAEQDAWFDLNLVDGEVTLEKMVWRKHGDANAWLKSEAFDLSSTYSIEASRAMERASAVARAARVSKKRFLEVDTELRRYLSDTDPFWIRWRYLGEKKGWL